MDYLVRPSGLLIRDNRLLLCKRYDSPIMLIPGGLTEKGETNEEALGRELKDELGLTLKSERLFREYAEKKALFHDYPIRILAYLIDAEGEPQPDNEIEKSLWLDEFIYKNCIYDLAPVCYSVIPDLEKAGHLDFNLDA
jgi:8-oxo-dGTP diphosphatase